MNVAVVRRLDPWLAGTVGALLLFGSVCVFSASVAIANRVAGNDYYFLLHHLVHVAVGLLLAAFAFAVPVRAWERAGPFLLLASLGLLLAVLIPGVGAHINGSSRWLKLGPLTIQPSEFARLFVIVYVAGYLVRRKDELHQFTKGILMVGAVLAVVGMLLLQEPDLGSVVVLTLTVFLMLFLGGVRFWHFLLTLVFAVGGMVALTVMSPYRMLRVTGFLDPWADPFNTGFQLVQALIAFGRGGWFGVGLGGSIQKVFYLPAAHTDFLLAIVAEELGLIGVIAVIALFAALVVRAFMIARVAAQRGQVYNAHLAQGLGLWFGLQAMINMGVNMGVLPTKGLTLPFMSYGGSSTLVCCLAAGILLRIERETRAGASR